MNEYSYLFQLALELSLLTFYIGALIYALPIPARDIKRWGGILVRDSITSYALALALLSILSFSNYIARLLGGSWTYFDLWLESGIALVMSAKILLAALGPLLSSLPVGSTLKALIGPFNDALTADLLFLITMAAVEVIVRYAGLLLAFIGLVLYSMPFRIGREAGAWFIAFVIVFSVGLQAMPAFISSIAQAPPLNMSSEALNLGVEFSSVKVLSSSGTPIGTSLLELYVYQNNRMTEVALYPVNSTGEAYSPSSPAQGMVSMPSETPVYAFVQVDGVTSPLEPYPISNSSSFLTLQSPYILYSNGYDLIVFTNQPQNLSVTIEPDRVLINGTLGSGGLLEARVPSTCRVNVSANVMPASGPWSWYGLHGTYYALYGPLNVSFYLNIGGCKPTVLKGVQYLDYLTQYLGSVPPISPNLIEDFVVYYFTVPLMYFAVLTTIAYAVARLLGGRRGIMPRVT